MATDKELKAYVQKLPRIYRDILAAFPEVDPNRKRGYGLAFQTLAAHFEQRGRGIGLGQIISACQELAEKGLVEIKHQIFVHPLDMGEKLISIVTGHKSPELRVPTLPLPPK